MIKGNAWQPREWERNWRILAKSFPTSRIAGHPHTMAQHRRKFQRWKHENPASAINPNAKTAHAIRRDFQILGKETL